MSIELLDGVYVFHCPHCEGRIEVLQHQTNCCIFRHAIWRSTREPINPHASLAECQQLLQNDLVWGCTKPFRLDLTTRTVSACEYI